MLHEGEDMKKKWLLTILIVLALAAGTYQMVKSTANKSSSEYQFASISRGDLESTISATGTLTPLVTIDVGTQVSGTVESVMVDYNDTVKVGQVLAVLDRTLLSAAVSDAEANVEKNEAMLEGADYNYQLNKNLFSKGMVSQADSVPISVNLKTQQATLKSAKVALDRAKRNLEYAVITSPIGGIVIEKNTEAGQTVASSFSTPTLFVIAQDLSRMEILAEVDESDIGQIKDGQNVRFEVATYSNKQFPGVVKQVRLQPKTVSNVVTYTVVVEAQNEDGLLLPGMTATIDFVIDSRTDILLVPTKALQYKPSDTQLAAFISNLAQQPRPDSLQTPPPTAPTNGTPPQDMGVVWYLNSLGQLANAPLKTGLSDGTNTEILASRDLTEGLNVITGTGSTASAQKTTSSALKMGPGLGGPPPGM